MQLLVELFKLSWALHWNVRRYWSSFYALDPVLDDLRSDPRFKEMLKRLNLPE
jgi:hypothetical protein